MEVGPNRYLRRQLYFRICRSIQCLEHIGNEDVSGPARRTLDTGRIRLLPPLSRRPASLEYQVAIQATSPPVSTLHCADSCDKFYNSIAKYLQSHKCGSATMVFKLPVSNAAQCAVYIAPCRFVLSASLSANLARTITLAGDFECMNFQVCGSR
jgi:hypothetical protein